MELVGAAEPGRHAAAMRVKLARTVSGDDEVQAGEEDAPDGRETEPHDSWWRAHKVIYASRLARTTAATARLQRAAVRRSGPAAAAASAAGTGGAAADPSGLTGSTTVQARSSALAFSWNRHLSFPIFALAFWPSFTRDLEWEYFFYSIAASRGSIARVCAYLAVQAAGEVLFLSINARHDAAGPTQVAAGAPHAIVFFFGRLALAVAAAALASVFAYCGRAGLKSHPIKHAGAVLLLMLLDGSMMAAADVTEISSSHTVLLVLLHLIGYAVLVPHIQARHVTFTFWLLLAFRLGFARAWHAPTTDLCATALHGAVVNLVGMALACLSESQNRSNFRSARVLLEEEGVKVALRDGVHRLLLNTLPAPIVRDIASGSTQVAHRYDEVTVLQADMVGFTNLSAQRSAEFVLGLLSDLFDKFDALTEMHHTHKVKTIGDAYIVCCGAFGDATSAAEAARRVTAMGISMLDEVAGTAKERNVDIGIRVGIHTGTAIGGIIGTVRFHFDMWGRAMLGAVKMEETGVAGRVHLSDATAALLAQAPRLSRQAPPFGSESAPPPHAQQGGATVSHGQNQPTVLHGQNQARHPEEMDASTGEASLVDASTNRDASTIRDASTPRDASFGEGFSADAPTSDDAAPTGSARVAPWTYSANRGVKLPPPPSSTEGKQSPPSGDGWLRGGVFELSPGMITDIDFRTKFQIERTYFASAPPGGLRIAAGIPGGGAALPLSAGGRRRRTAGGGMSTSGVRRRSSRRVSWPVRGSTDRGSYESYDDAEQIEHTTVLENGMRNDTNNTSPPIDGTPPQARALAEHESIAEDGVGESGGWRAGGGGDGAGCVCGGSASSSGTGRRRHSGFMSYFRREDDPNLRLGAFLTRQAGVPPVVAAGSALDSTDDLFTPAFTPAPPPTRRGLTAPALPHPTPSGQPPSAAPRFSRAWSLGARRSGYLKGGGYSEPRYMSQRDADSDEEGGAPDGRQQNSARQYNSCQQHSAPRQGGTSAAPSIDWSGRSERGPAAAEGPWLVRAGWAWVESVWGAVAAAGSGVVTADAMRPVVTVWEGVQGREGGAGGQSDGEGADAGGWTGGRASLTPTPRAPAVNFPPSRLPAPPITAPPAIPAPATATPMAAPPHTAALSHTTAAAHSTAGGLAVTGPNTAGRPSATTVLGYSSGAGRRTAASHSTSSHASSVFTPSLPSTAGGNTGGGDTGGGAGAAPPCIPQASASATLSPVRPGGAAVSSTSSSVVFSPGRTGAGVASCSASSVIFGPNQTGGGSATPSPPGRAGCAKPPSKARLDSSEMQQHSCFVDETNFFAKLKSPSGFPSPGWPAAGLRTCSGLGSAPAEASVARGMGGQPADACFGGNRDTPGGGGNGGYTGRGHSHGSGTHLSSGEGGLLSSSRRVNDAHTRAFLIRHLQLLFLWVLVYGLADATHFAVRYFGHTHIWPLLLVRYCYLVPALLFLLTWLHSSRSPSPLGNSLAAFFLIALPAVALYFVITHAGLDVTPCSRPYTIVPCAGGLLDSADAPLSEETLLKGIDASPPPVHFTEEGCTIMGSILQKIDPAAPLLPPPPPPPPPPAGIVQGDAHAFYCSELELDSGESLCQFFPFDYVTELLAWLTFFHYRLTHLPLLLLGIASAAISVGAVVLASREVDSFWHSQLHSGLEPQVPGLDDFVIFELTRMSVLLLFAHVVGALHHWSHGRELWRHLLLEARQRAVMRCIEEETASCDRLLKSILPPHLVGSLGSLEAIVRQGGEHTEGEPRLWAGGDSTEGGSQPGRPAGQAIPEGGKDAAGGEPAIAGAPHHRDVYRSSGGDVRADGGSGGGATGGGGALSVRGSGRVRFCRPPRPAQLAETFHDCSFLFAKIGGLSQLINDAEAEPSQVIGLLQRMFDRFDRLADVFQLQKVRKTANEYYLVAAGLPDPNLLPSAHDRAAAIAGFGFAMLNVMSVVNLELRNKQGSGAEFTVQVGIDSGSAIAGIIGHKTYQYDLCGDAVNTAARMCAYSEPGRVHVSQATYDLLRTRFGARPCGVRTIKGKGEMRTYFLENAPPAPDATHTPVTMPSPSGARGGGREGDDGGGGVGHPSSGGARITPPATTALWLERATAIVSPKPLRAPPLLMPPSIVAIGSSPPPVGDAANPLRPELAPGL